jgi:hypothetical protein
MSKILRRPMFRGGPVDSRGTGITSGLMDDNRVGYYRGGGPTYNPFTVSQVPADQLGANIVGRNTPNDLYDFTGKIDTIDLKEFLKPADITQQTDFKPRVTKTEKIEQPFEDDFEVSGEAGVVEDGKTGIDTIFEQGEERAKERTENNETNNNQPSNVEISAQDLIKENAELFKELLGEGQKEKIKKARIGDASDYLLKFFEGTQKEGATVGSAAADVAGFATSRDSRTEKARAANEKIDQTATVLAINDYISGKRSKEDIQKALSIAAATAKMKEGSIGDQILEVAARQTLTGGKIKEILGAAVGDGEARGIRTIPAGIVLIPLASPSPTAAPKISLILPPVKVCLAATSKI